MNDEILWLALGAALANKAARAAVTALPAEAFSRSAAARAVWMALPKGDGEILKGLRWAVCRLLEDGQPAASVIKEARRRGIQEKRRSALAKWEFAVKMGLSPLEADGFLKDILGLKEPDQLP